MFIHEVAPYGQVRVLYCYLIKKKYEHKPVTNENSRLSRISLLRLIVAFDADFFPSQCLNYIDFIDPCPPFYKKIKLIIIKMLSREKGM